MPSLVRVPTKAWIGGVQITDGTNFLTPEFLSSCQGVRRRRGVWKRREGAIALGDVPDVQRVNRLKGVTLRDTNYILRFDPAAIYNYDGSTDTWTDISGTETFIGTDTDVWAAASWDDTIYMSNGIAASGTQSYGTYKWAGTGNVSGVTDTGPGSITVPPARWIVAGYANRVWLLHTVESGTTRTQRVRYCANGDATDWSSTGAGAVDLADDPYPLTGGLVVAGRIVVFKGSLLGGSIVVGTETGVSTAPISWETLNPETGIGCYAPRSIVSIAGQAAIFLGHDDVYLFDGSTLSSIGEPIRHYIFTNYNPRALAGALAYYDPTNREYSLLLPLDGSSSATSERFIYDLDSRVWIGPEPATYTSATRYTYSDITRWNTAIGSWQDHTDTWQDMTSSDNDVRVALGLDDGSVVQLDPAASDDNGNPFVSYFETGDMTFEGVAVPHVIQSGKRSYVTQRTLRASDLKVLRSVSIHYRDLAAWTPTVEVSTDGGETWTTIGGGTALGSGLNTVHIKNYGCMITAEQIRIRLTASGPFEIRNITFEVGYAGPGLIT